MNVTELARKLRITPNELKEYLPELGFDIGQKAIKVDNSIANKIIRDWPRLKRRIDFRNADARRDSALARNDAPKEKKIIFVPHVITVREFSALSGLALNQILTVLMKNGIFTSLNEKIDYDTAWLVGTELGLEVKKKEETDVAFEDENKLGKILEKECKEKLLARAPVIVVMGHVDHGKTKLLDAIRSTHVVEGEAGGITQHIGAYQVVRKGQAITFIDTPGHEAFTAMRGRGARIADIAILVVAADDGVKPQTVEAFRIIESAKIPFVVAINKIDKPDANIDKVKQELASQLNITPEDWGGKTVCAQISALKNIGIDDLLDIVLLTAETELENIIANPDAEAVGTVIESHVDKGAGPVATILIQNGTLMTGDQLNLNNINIGKARNLRDFRGKLIKEAGPATPVQILGLKAMPQVGDMIEVGEGGLHVKHKKAKNISRSSHPQSGSEGEENLKSVNVIIKSDVFGSAEAIEESLMKINIPGVRAKIIHKGLGNITDGDIKRAEACNGQILAFNVKMPSNLVEVAREKSVAIKPYSIIYNLINDIKKEMELLVEPVIERRDLGKLKVLAVFRTDKESQIVGGKVLEGTVETDSKIEVFREKEFIDSGILGQLQAGKQDVNICNADEECGLKFVGQPIIKVGDILLFYKEEKIKNK